MDIIEDLRAVELEYNAVTADLEFMEEDMLLYDTDHVEAILERADLPSPEQSSAPMFHRLRALYDAIDAFIIPRAPTDSSPSSTTEDDSSLWTEDGPERRAQLQDRYVSILERREELFEAIGSLRRELAEGLAQQLAAEAAPVAAALPKVPVDAAMLSREEICAICRVKLNIGDEVFQIPCSHIFHPECLAEWMIISRDCPLCRRIITG